MTTRITSLVLTTGFEQILEISNDFIVICDGDKYLDGIQHHPADGTTVLTIRTNDEQKARP